MPSGNLWAGAVFAETRPVSQLLAETPAMRVVAFYLRPGQVVPPHTSPCRVLMVVVKGRGTLGTGQGSQPVGPGDWALCEPDEPHSFSASEEMVLLAVIAPSPSAHLGLSGLTGGDAPKA